MKKHHYLYILLVLLACLMSCNKMNTCSARHPMNSTKNSNLNEFPSITPYSGYPNSMYALDDMIPFSSTPSLFRGLNPRTDDSISVFSTNNNIGFDNQSLFNGNTSNFNYPLSTSFPSSLTPPSLFAGGYYFDDSCSVFSTNNIGVDYQSLFNDNTTSNLNHLAKASLFHPKVLGLTNPENDEIKRGEN